MSKDTGYVEGCLWISAGGTIDWACLGMVYGVHSGCLEALESQVYKYYSDFVDTEELDENLDYEINFVLSNIHWDEGQMTFPETGQWDFAPSWQFDFKEVSRVAHDCSEKDDE